MWIKINRMQMQSFGVSRMGNIFHRNLQSMICCLKFLMYLHVGVMLMSMNILTYIIIF